jgi:hypothetical protein
MLQPDWWMLSRGAELVKGGIAPISPQPGQTKRRSLRDTATAGAWASAVVGGDRLPPPRYEHAVTLFRRKLWLIGGNCSQPLPPPPPVITFNPHTPPQPTPSTHHKHHPSTTLSKPFPEGILLACF